jgi:hypothetical protein
VNIPSSINLAGLGQPVDKLAKRVRQTYEQLAKAFNGNVEFGNPTSGPVNILGVWASPVTPGVANTDFVVVHNLGKPCVGYDVKTKSAACDVYTSPTANASPNTQIILRASAAGIALTLFLH